MIYLIKSHFIGKKFIYKVGFTDNIDERMSHYFYMNPGFEVVSVREGDEVLESLLHYYLRFLGLQYKKDGKLNEWFLGDERVRQIFHISRESLERKIWENRDKIFDKDRVRSERKLDNSLFQFLYEKNKDSFIGEQFFIKDGSIIKTKALKVDLEFKKYLIKSRQLEFPKVSFSDCLEKMIFDFLDNHFYKTGIFEKRLEMYCEFMDQYSGEINQKIQKIICSEIKDDRFRKYYNFFETKGCRAFGYIYIESKLKAGISDISCEKELRILVEQKFKVGERYTKKDIKFILTNLYRDLGITERKAKATDLEKYFVLERSRISNPETKKLEEGYRIVGIKIINTN